MTMPDCIRGLWAAMATPLDADGAVDHAALVRHGLWLMEHGCDGLVPFGTTGEGPSFAAGEKLAAVEALLKAGIAADRIAIGSGCPAIPDTVALTRAAMGMGLQHALVLPPYYFRDATEAGVEAAFARIIEGVGSAKLRLTAYNIPQVSGVAVAPAALARLRQRFGAIVAGVKDSTGNWESFLAFRRGAPALGTLVGDETLIARALVEGGVGTICGMVNLMPDLVRAMFAGEAGTETMRAACKLIQGPFIALMKAALAAQTGDGTWRNVRAPLLPADPAQGAQIAAALAALRTRQAAE
jgi:4-hydroxy-tetrahydrodipicolinate synthase